MKPQRQVVLFVILTLLILALTCNAQAEVLKFAPFSSRNFDLKVLTADSWEATFGKNLKVPRTDEDVLALARQIYPPLGAKSLMAKGKKWHCGDMKVGLLFAALQNPAIKDETREAVDLIIIQPTPPLPEEYTSGRFRILYTTNDPDPLNNVTLEEVRAVAADLNANWDPYATKFTEPMHYHNGDGDDVIDVWLYYIDDETWGQTSSAWVHIEINTIITLESCTRKITAAHELFHRVQFAYGYQTVGDDWLVEGSATWVEKYRYPTEREYMDWMNEGLKTPTKDLLARDYDAAHLFVYLTERSTWRTVRDTWANYQIKGAEQAFKDAVETNTGLTFMNFLRNWHTANYVKDLRYAPPKYDYTEDEVTKIDCALNESGPLESVPVFGFQYVVPFTYTGSVERYGADYVEFETPTNPKNLTIKINGGADFSYRIIPVRGKTYLRVYSGDTNPFTFTRPSGTGKWTKLAILVVGGASGGSYTINFSELGVTYVESDAYYQWYHHDFTKGPSCENEQRVGVDDEFKTAQRLPIRLAASCGTNAWSNTTIQRIEPTHIAIDFSAYAHSLYRSDPADPLNRISGAAHGTEGLISAGTYTVEINPVISYSWLSTEYVGIEFRLYLPDSLDPYMTFGCTEMPPYSQRCSLPITREITIPENEMHRWTFYVAADTGFDDGDPETIEISGRALSIKRKEE